MPSFQKLFPDLTTGNLNNVNDLAFSAASTSRIVVPKGGAVPFVIFVPVEPLEQACWLNSGYKAAMDYYPHSACDAIYDSNSQPIAPYRLRNAKKKNFKDWTPVELTALQKHSYAVVAGAHIKEINPLGASLRSITCSTSSDVLHIADALGKPLACVLSGADLDTMLKLRLKAPGLANPIDATVTINGDSTTAKATIAVADVANLKQPTYSLYSVDKSGNENDLKYSLTVIPAPVFDPASFSPATLALLKTNPTLTIQGQYLDQVKQVEFVDPATSLATVTSAAQASPDGKALTVQVGSSDAAKLTAAKYGLVFVLDPVLKDIYDTKTTFPSP
jgi:hypothetical protein